MEGVEDGGGHEGGEEEAGTGEDEDVGFGFVEEVPFEAGGVGGGGGGFGGGVLWLVFLISVNNFLHRSKSSFFLTSPRSQKSTAVKKYATSNEHPTHSAH